MDKKCSKCLTVIPEEYFVCYAIPAFGGLDNISLCHQCNCVYENRNFMLNEFLKEDFGLFPVGIIDKKMIEARKARSLGEGAWNSNEDLLQKIP